MTAGRGRLPWVRAALPAQAEEVLDDERLEAFLSFQLFLLIQDAVDLGSHLVVARGLGVPGSHREVFDLLAGAGLLAADTAHGMGGMIALRNRIAHSDGDLDPVRMVREAPEGLTRLETLLDELAGTIATA